MTAALLIQQPDGTMRDVPLVAERTLIGRSPECDVVLEGRMISRHHACIRRDDTGYILEDLGSHNGTTLNGQPLSSPHILQNGDSVELGGIGRLTFVDDDATSSRILPPAADIALDTGTQDAWVDGQRLVPPLSPAQFSLLQLLLDRAGALCSRDDIAAAVWPDAHDGISDEAIDALIKRLRARLAEVPGGQRYLVTVRGRGLMLRRDVHS
jgi:predicted component of type VI protein secretion system